MLSTSRPTPNLEDQGIPLRLAPTLDLSGLGDPTNSYTTAGMALKPHHHDKVGIASVGDYDLVYFIIPTFAWLY
jgi:hypothetical protein